MQKNKTKQFQIYDSCIEYNVKIILIQFITKVNFNVP